MSRLFNTLYKSVFVFFFGCFLIAQSVFASTTNGTIDSANNTACFLNTIYDCVNFGLSQGDVHVTDSALTGYVWSSTLGWINLSPTKAGVKNDSTGKLSGYAWGERIGWINFDANLSSQASIDSQGIFHGYAWSDTYGWLSLNCDNDGSCASKSFKLSTDWRPASVRNPGTNGGGGGPIEPAPTPTPTPPPPEPSPEPLPTSSPAPSSEPAPVEPPPSAPPPSTPPSSGPGAGGSISTSNGSNISNFISQSTNAVSQVADVVAKQAIIVAVQTAKIVNATAEKTKEIVGSDSGQIVSKVVSTTGVVVTTAVVTAPSLFLSTFSLSDILLIPFRLWALLLAAFGLKKRNRPWGTVYDSVTKQPLDPAYVTLLDTGGREVASAITDLDGRYGFIALQPGVYRVNARKTNYDFPSKKLLGKSADELYSDLYFGEPIVVHEAGSVILKNVPLDPIGFDWNEFAKSEQRLMLFYSRRELLVRILTDWFFRIGFTITIIASAVAPVPYNLIMFAVYIFLAVLRILGDGKKPYGAVKNKATGTPIPYAVVRIFNEGSDQVRLSKVCDRLGRYYCLIPNGRYYIKIERKNPDESYTGVHISPVFTVTSGIINTTFEV